MNRYNSLDYVEPNRPVEAELKERIIRQGQITFAEFMDVCLYSSNGYYVSPSAGIGRDFKTAPETHSGFGYVLGNVISTLSGASDDSSRDFNILEMGGGNGTLAKSILEKLARSNSSLLERTRYIIVDRSSSLIEKQRELLQKLPVDFVQGAAHEAPPNIDIALSNELLDVMAVHRLRMRGGRFTELFVTINRSGKLIEIEDELSPEIQNQPEASTPPNLPEGAEITLSPTRTRWLQHMAGILRKSGHLITIDYATEPFTKDPHSYVPRVYANFLEPPTGHPIQLAYERPGIMDITASVDFGQLVRQGTTLGLETIYHDTQANFLRRYGYEEEHKYAMEREIRGAGRDNALAHYFASYVLLSPEQMGNHQVLIQEVPQNKSN